MYNKNNKYGINYNCSYCVCFFGLEQKMNIFLNTLINETSFIELQNKIKRDLSECYNTYLGGKEKNKYVTIETFRNLLKKYRENKDLSDFFGIDSIHEIKLDKIKLLTYNINRFNIYNNYGIEHSSDRIAFPNVIQYLFPDITIILLDYPRRQFRIDGYTYNCQFVHKKKIHLYNFNTNPKSNWLAYDPIVLDYPRRSRNNNYIDYINTDSDKKIIYQRTALLQVFNSYFKDNKVTIIIEDIYNGNQEYMIDEIHNTLEPIINEIILRYNTIYKLSSMIFEASFNVNCRLGRHMFDFRLKQDNIHY